MKNGRSKSARAFLQRYRVAEPLQRISEDSFLVLMISRSFFQLTEPGKSERERSRQRSFANIVSVPLKRLQ
jgi:hypothetical protein